MRLECSSAGIYDGILNASQSHLMIDRSVTSRESVSALPVISVGDLASII